MFSYARSASSFRQNMKRKERYFASSTWKGTSAWRRDKISLKNREEKKKRKQRRYSDSQKELGRGEKVSSLSNVLPRGNPGFWWKIPCEGKNNKKRTGRPKKSGKESRLGKARVRRVYIFFPICKKTRGSVEKGRRERMERGRAPGGEHPFVVGGPRESAGSLSSPPGSSSSRRCFPQQPFFSLLQVGLSPYFFVLFPFLFFSLFIRFPTPRAAEFGPVLLGFRRVWTPNIFVFLFLGASSVGIFPSLSRAREPGRGATIYGPRLRC